MYLSISLHTHHLYAHTFDPHIFFCAYYEPGTDLNNADKAVNKTDDVTLLMELTS